MPISRILGASDVCRRGDPPVRVSDAKQMRVFLVSDQCQHWVAAEVKSQPAPLELALRATNYPAASYGFR